ncbi:MAG: chromosome segregation protein SMC [Candidatus Methanomethylophilaceae archaeon]|nr:chromosome segregation protein SMC [Candidatus Methanomethylophilaceae archaeon]
MYLKQVELENFKSFGGKLTVPLMEGYTAITGPNGSGKSNITDAILFVLGPKSSKAVRAGKLTDLIFDGGKSKNKASYTKVSLVFDNTDRLMPWDDDEVRLTRYVKLSDNGQDYSSYFYVNDRKSTMSEFDTLLTKARISADGYNMVQQGDVMRIVQMGNSERRRILDSISGIASFDADIEKAKGERFEAETNLDRVTIITGELETELKRLERDRSDAQRYLEAKGALDIAKAQYSHRMLQMETAKLESINDQIGRISKRVEDDTQKRDAKRLEQKAKEEEIAAKEEEIAAKIGPEYKEIKQKIEDARVDLATKRSVVENAESDLEQQSEFRRNFEESLASNEGNIKQIQASRDDQRIRLEELEGMEKAAVAEERSISEQIASTGGEQQELQVRQEQVEKDVDACSEELREAQGRMSKAEASSEEAHSSFEALDTKAQNIDFEIKDAKWSLEQLKAEAGPSIEDYGQKVLALKGKERELEKQEQELDAAYRRIDQEYNALQAEKKVSQRVNRGAEAVEAILSLRNRGEMKGIHGTIQELATVDKGYETALAVAAGGKMQAVVVDDDQIAADCIGYLKREKLGRVTFLPLNKMMGGKPRAKAIMSLKDTDGYAIDLIDFDQRYYNAFWYVLGDTLVANNMDTARRIMGGIRIVTVAGELIDPSGAMSGGNISQQNLLKFGTASEDKLTELGEKLRKAMDALEGVRTELRRVRDDIRAADDEMRNASSSGMAQREQMAQLSGSIKELERSKKEVSEQIAAVRAKVADADREFSDAKDAFTKLSARMTELTDERQRIKARIAEIAPAELQARIQSVRNELYNIREEKSGVVTEISGANVEIEGYRKQNESLQMQLDRVLEQIKEDEDAIEQGTAAMERAKIDLEALKQIEAEMESGIEDLRNQKDALKDQWYTLDSQLKELAKDIENSLASKSSFEAQAITQQAAIEARKAEVAAITIEVPEPIPSEEEIRRTIRAKETVIAEIGNVNLRAIEDYDEKKARYDKLMAEVADLNSTIKGLNDLMDDLSAKKKGLFMAAYDAVNANFKAVYAELSMGGEAFMGLENEDDPFEGGLMINAKPRNGKLLRLEALSGGEKSLTALAFIFAIQEYQPSPFYVFDEVDQNLDSVNSELVAKRIVKSSAKAQFIQVSLRKVTLAMADHLIGVTRPPSGISKVIMQPDLAEVSSYEEQAAKQSLKDEAN